MKKIFFQLSRLYNENTGANDSDTWCLISYGQNAAITFIGSFYQIFDSVK